MTILIEGTVNNSTLSVASTTPTVTVSRASTAWGELCDVSNDGLSALLGRLPASLLRLCLVKSNRTLDSYS
jgi:hypothetical protein